MKVLALDMTIRNTGYSIWELQKYEAFGRVFGWRWRPLISGCISPADQKGKDYQMLKDIRRCQELIRELERLVNNNDICAIVVELLAGTKTAKTAQTFGLVTGVLASILEKYALPVYIYNAMAVKKTLTGRKEASKEDVIKAVLELFPEFCRKNGFKRKKSPMTGKLQWPAKLEHVADSMGLMIHAEDQSDFRGLAQLAAGMREVETSEDDSFFD
jgi:Holliday junction resolvasome RuvABC endonuclease subunit